MLGPWPSAGRPEDTVSILEGLRAALPHCRIDHLAGVPTGGADEAGVAAAIGCCRAAQLVILCLGEDPSMSGEGGSRSNLGLPAGQRALADAVLACGKPVVVLLSCG